MIQDYTPDFLKVLWGKVSPKFLRKRNVSPLSQSEDGSSLRRKQENTTRRSLKGCEQEGQKERWEELNLNAIANEARNSGV